MTATTTLLPLVMMIVVAVTPSSAVADVMFELSDEGGGATRFTASGFSGDIVAGSDSTSDYLFDLIFPIDFFGLPAGIQQATTSNTLEINGTSLGFSSVHDNSQSGSPGDLFRLSAGSSANAIAPGAITSFSGSFVVENVDFSSLSLPASSSSYWSVTGTHQLGEVSFAAATEVPEPSALALVGLGVLGLVLNRRRAAAPRSSRGLAP